VPDDKAAINLSHFSLHFYYHLPFYVSLAGGGHVANNRYFKEKCGKS
jgi:hypothetical protein